MALTMKQMSREGMRVDSTRVALMGGAAGSGLLNRMCARTLEGGDGCCWGCSSSSLGSVAFVSSIC